LFINTLMVNKTRPTDSKWTGELVRLGGDQTLQDNVRLHWHTNQANSRRDGHLQRVGALLLSFHLLLLLLVGLVTLPCVELVLFVRWALLFWIMILIIIIILAIITIIAILYFSKTRPPAPICGPLELLSPRMVLLRDCGHFVRLLIARIWLMLHPLGLLLVLRLLFRLSCSRSIGGFVQLLGHQVFCICRKPAHFCAALGGHH